MGSSDPGFWSDPDVVARFRDRDPDIHLIALLGEITDVSALRTLDLGCAGGRNAATLRDLEAPVTAIDASHPMCVATRDRVGGHVARARMDRIPCRTASFELVLALGIYHQADSDDEVRDAFAETARVLRPGGAVLLSVFSTEMLDPSDRPVRGMEFTFDTAAHGRAVRFTPENLGRLLGDLGFETLRPLEVRRGTSVPSPKSVVTPRRRSARDVRREKGATPSGCDRRATQQPGMQRSPNVDELRRRDTREKGPRISLLGLYGLPPAPIPGPGNRDEIGDDE